MGTLSPFSFPRSDFNLSRPARRYHCFYAPPARPAANLTAGLCLIYEKIANIPNCRCLSSRCGAGRQNARCSIFTQPLASNLHPKKIASQTGKKRDNCAHLIENWSTYLLLESFHAVKLTVTFLLFFCTIEQNVSPLLLQRRACSFSSSLFQALLRSPIYLPRRETNEQSFQYWSRLNSYCSCRNAI